jgi:hypothetical protein
MEKHSLKRSDENMQLLTSYDNYFFYKNFENVPYKIVFSRCQIRVQESARMQDFAPFTPDPRPYSNCTLHSYVMEGY